MICANRHLNFTLNFLSWTATWNLYTLVWRQNVSLSQLKPLCAHPTAFHRGSHCSKHIGIDPLWATGKGKINYRWFPIALQTFKLDLRAPRAICISCCVPSEARQKCTVSLQLGMPSPCRAWWGIIHNNCVSKGFMGIGANLVKSQTSSVVRTVKGLGRWFWLLPAPWDLWLLAHPLSIQLFQL